MNVAGIDYSTRAVDIVTVPYDGNGQPKWHRYELDGKDAFDRARFVADAMPVRRGLFWDDIMAVGIEHPGGNFGTREMCRIQGAILSCIPYTVLVEPWPPAKWRKAVGLAGNADKGAVYEYAFWRGFHAMLANTLDIPQDACDAYCIAVATRQAITTTQAA